MDSPLYNIDELLSGMLDGTLTDAELSELEKAMALDPSLEQRLEELSWMRRSLMSGRSTQKLGAHFAQRITQEAKSRARSMENAPSWVLPEVNRDEIASPTERPQIVVSEPADSSGAWRWVMYPAALALAAALLVMLNWSPKESSLGVISNIVEQSAESSDPPSNLDVPSGLGGEESKIAENSSAPKADTTPLEVTPIQPEAVTVEQPNAIADNTSRIADNVPKSVPEAMNTSVVSNDNVVSALPSPNTDKNPLANYLLVIDIAVDPVAIESGALDAVMERHGIVSTNDLAISEKQVDLLVDSMELSKDKPTPEQDRIGLMFVRAPGKALGAAIKDVYNQYEDFPEIFFNMANHESLGQLVHQLSSVPQIASANQGAAGRLSRNALPNVSQPFVAVAPKGKRVEKRNINPPVMADYNKLSNCLIIIRPAKK